MLHWVFLCLLPSRDPMVMVSGREGEPQQHTSPLLSRSHCYVHYHNDYFPKIQCQITKPWNFLHPVDLISGLVCRHILTLLATLALLNTLFSQLQ